MLQVRVFYQGNQDRRSRVMKVMAQQLLQVIWLIAQHNRNQLLTRPKQN